MSHFINLETTDGKWWKGKVTLNFNYNLKNVLIVLLSIIGVAILCFAFYWLSIGIMVALKWIWSGMCWLSGYWMWIVGAFLLALLIWGLTKIKWPKRKPKEERELKVWPFIVLLILALVGVFCLRQCSSPKHKVAPQESVVVTPENFNETFDWVVTTRAYLDGVQRGTAKSSRALVGFKFVNGEPVTNKIFEGRTYEEAVKVVADDWRDLIVDNLGGTKLTERQLVAVTLFAMRNGKYGFLNSDFLKEIQNGNTKGAETKMYLHKANGEKRILGQEGHQYLWVLMQIYNGNVDYKALLDMPMFSYKYLPESMIYDVDGKPVFTDEALYIMKDVFGQTPRQALEL